jgi:FtsP/CotA-like multicopper oxidase with cupredoxin domain
MAHPMHRHGHHFQLTGINDTALAGAMRDTVLVPPMASVRIEFDAGNPGRWLFHCHNLFHMAAGMMTELVYS